MLKTVKTFAHGAISFVRNIAGSAKNKLSDDSGVGVIEVILILLVLVGLVIIFKSQITSLARSIFSNITSQAGGI